MEGIGSGFSSLRTALNINAAIAWLLRSPFTVALQSLVRWKERTRVRLHSQALTLNRLCEYYHRMIDPLQMLKTRIEKSTQVQVALDLGISTQYLGDMLHGRRTVGPKVIKALGLEKRVIYRRINGGVE